MFDFWTNRRVSRSSSRGRLCSHLAKRGRRGAKTYRERRSRSDRSGRWSLRRWGRACIHRICPLNRKWKYPKFLGDNTENSNLVSRNYSIRTYSTSSNSNLVNRTYCPKPLQSCLALISKDDGSYKSKRVRDTSSRAIWTTIWRRTRVDQMGWSNWSTNWYIWRGYHFCCMARSLRSLRQVATLRHGHKARRSASLRSCI